MKFKIKLFLKSYFDIMIWITLILCISSILFYGNKSNRISDENLKFSSNGEKFYIEYYLNSLENENNTFNSALKKNPYLFTFAIKKHYTNFIDVVLKNEKVFNYQYMNYSYYFEAIKSNDFETFSKLLLLLDIVNNSYENYLINDFQTKIIYSKYTSIYHKEFIQYILNNSNQLYTQDYNYLFEALLNQNQLLILDEFKSTIFKNITYISKTSTLILIQLYPSLFGELLEFNLIEKNIKFEESHKELIKKLLIAKKYNLIEIYLKNKNDKQLNQYILNYYKYNKDEQLFKIIKKLKMV